MLLMNDMIGGIRMLLWAFAVIAIPVYLLGSLRVRRSDREAKPIILELMEIHDWHVDLFVFHSIVMMLTVFGRMVSEATCNSSVDEAHCLK